jgi:hypothetical protein
MREKKWWVKCYRQLLSINQMKIKFLLITCGPLGPNGPAGPRSPFIPGSPFVPGLPAMIPGDSINGKSPGGPFSPWSPLCPLLDTLSSPG